MHTHTLTHTPTVCAYSGKPRCARVYFSCSSSIYGRSPAGWCRGVPRNSSFSVPLSSACWTRASNLMGDVLLPCVCWEARPPARPPAWRPASETGAGGPMYCYLAAEHDATHGYREALAPSPQRRTTTGGARGRLGSEVLGTRGATRKKQAPGPPCASFA